MIFVTHWHGKINLHYHSIFFRKRGYVLNNQTGPND